MGEGGGSHIQMDFINDARAVFFFFGVCVNIFFFACVKRRHYSRVGLGGAKMVFTECQKHDATIAVR